jgi:hypothetical protein
MNELLSMETDMLLTNKGYFSYKPTVADVVMWLYETHHIWLWVSTRDIENETDSPLFIACARFVPTKRKGKFEIDPVLHQPKHTPQEAYEFGIKHILTNLV